MKKMLSMAALLILGGLFCMQAQEKDLQITIVYDNYPANKSLGSDWGFACHISYGKSQLLFDAGRKPGLYESNMTQLGIDPADSPALFISHYHGDHTAGMPWICKKNPDILCYLPESYRKMLEESGELPSHSKGYIRPTHLFGPFYTTGDNFENFREQGLVVRTSHGGVLVTGCGHPGALEMIQMAEKELGIEIYALVGGLHLMRHSDQELSELVRGLKAAGIEKICPTHCTGDHSMEYLAKAFGDGFIPGGSGAHISIQ